MLRSIADIVSFFKSLSPNLKVIIARFGLANFVYNVNTYGSIYLVALGASGAQIGLLNSVSLGLTSLFAFATGWICDRRSRKRIFLIGASLGGLVPVIYAVAPSWLWVLPAFILAGVADGIIQPAFTTIYANSVRDDHRGTIYGLVNVFTATPIFFAGLVGGLIVSYFGGLTASGIRPVYILQAVILIAVVLLVWRYLEPETANNGGPISLRDIFEDYREVLRIKGARNWALMKSLGSFSIGMAGPFWMLYADLFKGASAMTMAYMVVARGVITVLLSPMSGRLTDAIGRKKMIVGGRTLMYIGTAVFLLSPFDWVLVFAWVLMGINDATGVAWQAEEVELVKHSQRARMTALSVGSFNLLAVPASILGGYLWDYVNPIAPFVVMTAIDGCIRMPFIHYRIPEGKNH